MGVVTGVMGLDGRNCNLVMCCQLAENVSMSTYNSFFNGVRKIKLFCLCHVCRRALGGTKMDGMVTGRLGWQKYLFYLCMSTK